MERESIINCLRQKLLVRVPDSSLPKQPNMTPAYKQQHQKTLSRGEHSRRGEGDWKRRLMSKSVTTNNEFNAEMNSSQIVSVQASMPLPKSGPVVIGPNDIIVNKGLMKVKMESDYIPPDDDVKIFVEIDETLNHADHQNQDQPNKAEEIFSLSSSTTGDQGTMIGSSRSGANADLEIQGVAIAEVAENSNFNEYLAIIEPAPWMIKRMKKLDNRFEAMEYQDSDSEDEIRNFSFPTSEQRSHVKTLCLRWVTPKVFSDLMQFFPNVTNLEIQSEPLPLPKGNVVHVHKKVEKVSEQFQRIVGQLKSISIGFDFNDFTFLQEILNLLVGCNPRFTEITIVEDSSNNESLEGESKNYEPAMSILFKIISSSAQMLKSLEICFSSESMRRALGLKVTSKLRRLKKLNLEVLNIYGTLYNTQSNDQELIAVGENEFLEFQRFVKSQSSLKELTLPWCLTATLNKDFIRILPRNIHKLRVLQKEHTPEFLPNFFKDLEELSIAATCDSTIIRLDHGGFHNLKKLGVLLLEAYSPDINLIETSCNKKMNILFEHIGEAFMNLVELKIIALHSQFTNLSLQIIIANQKQLRTLAIGYCNISDFGISGVDERLIGGLIQGNYHLAKVPVKKAKGLPISSLEKLEKLILCADQSALPNRPRITDVGIFLGFGTPQPREKLFELNYFAGLDEVDDRIKYKPGMKNPGLEVFLCGFETNLISIERVEKLKELLPQTEIKLSNYEEIIRIGDSNIGGDGTETDR